MTEQKDEIRLKQLLSVFGEDRQKEIIEILHRDQIRYHQEQLILSGVVVPKGTLCLDCEKNPAVAGYDLHFCEECWDNAVD